MRKLCSYTSMAAFVIGMLATPYANAQNTNTTETPAAQDAETVGDLEEIVVTGTTARNRTVLESSVAITAVDAEGLARKAPRSTASALQLVPGIFVEDSGGEVSNNFSVRGLAGGAQTFIQISEDGLPVFYTNALTDTILKQEISIDRLEAVRGGTSGILTVNGAGATINFITRKPTDQFEGTVRLTGSDFNTKRIDVFYGGPLSENWRFSVSGFYRSSDSVRDTGFTADHGGLVRFQLLREFDDGSFGINVKVVDDHNTFLLPIPLANPADPQGIPGLSATKGTLVSLDSGVQTVRTSPASGRAFQTNDVTDGVATKSLSIGFNFDKEIISGLTLRAKGRYTDFKNDFNAVFNFDNNTLVPATARLDPTRFSEIGLLLNRFAPQGAVRAGLRVVSTGEIISSTSALNALNGNGLTADGITANNQRDVKEFASDISLSYETDRNLLSVGVLFFDTNVNDGNIGASTFISDVSNSPRRLDIVALNASNQVVGFLTENGLLNFGSFGEGVSRTKQESLSLYANNEFKVTERLRIDAGIRLEFFNIDRLEGISTGPLAVAGAFDAQGRDVDNIIANNFIAQFGGGAFTGNFRQQNGDFEEIAYTLGGSYRLLDNLAAYGRFARGFQANGQNPVTEIEFAELGLRFQQSGLSASITGFTTRFKDFRFSRQLPGAVLPTEFNGDIKVLGAEFDLTWRPFSFVQIQALGVIQNSRLDIKDDQGTGFASSFDGNQPERTPETNITITPSFFLPNDLGEVYFSVRFLGKRFSDLANSLELPAYTTLDAGVTFNIGKSLTLAVNGQNLTNEIGLTEGNPRSGFTENPGVSNFFYARPILGRNFVATLTYNF
jgi:iron complex outermembrane recepter protein